MADDLSEKHLIEVIYTHEKLSEKIKFIIKNTITGQIISLFWVMFIIQFIIYPIFIGPIIINETISTHWSSLFTLSVGNEQYVWTYFTSIFSHGGIFHIILNSIVLFSFGLIIENEFSKKQYLAMFILFGLIANIAQILTVNVAYSINFIPIYIESIDEFMLLGASGAIAGFIGLVTIKAPNAIIQIIILPFIKFKLITGVILFLLLSNLLILVYGFGAFNIAHVAHIVGILSGMIYGIKLYVIEDVEYVVRTQYYNFKLLYFMVRYI